MLLVCYIYKKNCYGNERTINTFMLPYNRTDYYLEKIRNFH